MKKRFAASIVAVVSILAVTTTADAAQGCGAGWHRNGWGNCVRNAFALHPAHPVCGRYSHWNWRWGRCVRNRAVVYVPPPPRPVPVYRQTILAPARTGVIPGSARSAGSVCSYGYHPNPHGDCTAN